MVWKAKYWGEVFSVFFPSYFSVLIGDCLNFLYLWGISSVLTIGKNFSTTWTHYLASRTKCRKILTKDDKILFHHELYYYEIILDEELSEPGNRSQIEDKDAWEIPRIDFERLDFLV